MPKSHEECNASAALDLADTALRRARNGEGKPASRLLLVAAIYAHLDDVDGAEVREVIRQTLANAGVK